MPDILDFYNSVARTKQTIVKGYTATTSTSGTSYIDSTSISVPNNWYYAFIFDYSVNTGTTGTWQLLEGATQKATSTFTGNAANILYDPKATYQNISGSTQTVKLQVKSNGAGASPTVSLNHVSIIASPNPILYAPAIQITSALFSRNLTLPIQAYITSMDILIAAETGSTTPEMVYDGTLFVADSQTTPQTTAVNRLVNFLGFVGSVVSVQQSIYIAYDWSGSQVTV